ncbi:MAG TPA: hypothetical protein H9717_08595 [Candidatus Eisenbergiella merdipullorum]|uniref:Lipoprotein n=1 Tax=Candidatus Eisenbergiella merdipullorum TaxID=2838553 RepID=A0A9D2I6G8_9FIRM|nr:hypothetical protein [Candidatus Eisenbergiella merdipullorum]
MRRLVLLLLAAAMLLAGCGGNKSTEDVTSLEFKKNGEVVHTIVEDFSASYYSLEELESQVQAQVDEYNTNAGSQRIRVDSAEVTDGVITMVMTFEGAEDYSSFYRQALFCGTVKDAFNAGYDLDVQLASAQAEGASIGRQDILEMGERHIAVVREPIVVKTYADILYASGSVEVTGNREATVTDSQELSYIIFR